MATKYVLDASGEPVEEPELMRWARWMENSTNRRIAEFHLGKVRVSTVIFGGEHDGYQRRGSTKVHALKMHQDAVKLVQEKTIKLNIEERKSE